jgi:putative glutamine amidotransferase
MANDKPMARTIKVMSRKPVIGINLDYYPAGQADHPLLQNVRVGIGHSNYPHHVINLKYHLAVEAAGGVPIMLPHAFESIDQYVELVDGFLFVGGLMDIPPEAYGEEADTDTLYLDCQRTSFDMTLGKRALESGKPILGICSGVQLLNVLTGGALYQHIPNHFPSNINHFCFYEREEYVHEVHLTENTRLRDIAGVDRLAVNSAHHMAVKSVGAGMVINATAPDGVPEGIESTTHDFVMGVQWHPEFLTGPHGNLFSALVKAANRA